MPLINCKVELSLVWIENCISATSVNVANDAIANAAKAAFKINDAKLYISVVTALTQENAKLSKLLSGGFKRSVYWSKYKVIDKRLVEINDANVEKPIREWLDASYQGVKRFFVLVYDNTVGNN